MEDLYRSSVGYLYASSFIPSSLLPLPINPLYAIERPTLYTPLSRSNPPTRIIIAVVVVVVVDVVDVRPPTTITPTTTTSTNTDITDNTTQKLFIWHDYDLVPSRTEP